MKILRTPPSKLEDFKVFDQSQEPLSKDLIDQLEEVSKEVSSPSDNRLAITNSYNNFTVGNSVFRTEKRIHKDKLP